MQPRQNGRRNARAIHQQYIESQPTETVFFTWHGGEPTLLGIDFFKKVVELQQKYCPPGKHVENDLQTNGTLLNDEWCSFLKEHHFLVGLSIDGPSEFNGYRVTNNGKDSTEAVIQAAAVLNKYKVPFNTLTVVHRFNAKEPLKVYNFLKDVIGSRHMQFIPCVEPKNFKDTAPLTWDEASLPVQGSSAATPGSGDSFVTDFTIESADWGSFLSSIFNEWYKRDQGNVFVYLFENFLSSWMKKGPLTCLFGETCGHAMALDRDGSVYACDHFCYPEYRYGNIAGQHLSSMGQSTVKKKFEAVKQALPGQCKTCRWLSKCFGECPKKRFVKTRDGEPGLNYLCEGYRHFFETINSRMFDLVKKYS